MEKLVLAALFLNHWTHGGTNETGGKPHYPIDSPMEGPVSIYTPAMVKLLESWPPKDINYSQLGPGPVQLVRINTPGQKYLIGAEQVMLINAPIESVERVLDDVDHFKDLMPGFADIHLIAKDGNRLTVFWESIVPVFFIRNVKYETIYLIDKSAPNRKIYRYKLKASTSVMNSADGVIVLERKGATLTLHTQYDFWDCNYGIAKGLLDNIIWKDSLKGIYVADSAIKLKAEHVDWSFEKIGKEAAAAWDAFPVDEMLKNGKPFTQNSRELKPTNSKATIQ